MMKNTSTQTKSKNLTFEQKAFLVTSELKKARDTRVVNERFGLINGQTKTLESIGSDLHITRERVRQIEKTSTAKLKQIAETINEIKQFHKKLNSAMESFGGFTNEERLVSFFLPTRQQNPVEIKALIFLATLDKKIERHMENKEYRTFWSMAGENLKTFYELSKKIDELLEKKKTVLNIKQIASTLECDTNILESIMWTKKMVLETEEKKWGLRTWREVNPKSIRDKTYVILKSSKEPLHYSVLADRISNHKSQKKPVTKQAVHNELIRDPRFVLIGRGIYALGEWGYTPGVVEDVIKEILTEHGQPMHKNDIITKVKEKRIVKETTIILNLQKNSFKRISRAIYTINNK